MLSVTNRDDEEALEDVSDLAVGEDHICAVSAGVVHCWGAGERGQLGSEIAESRLPVPVPGTSSAFAVAAGPGFTCAALGSDPSAGGAVRCWGAGTAGQLGDGSSTDTSAPRDVEGLSDIVDLAAGAEFVCAAHATGAVSCWGAGAEGQLGDGSETPRPRPVSVTNIDDAVEVVASDHGACARRAGGGVRCWGSNDAGQARGTSGANATEATNVVGLARAVAITAGRDSYCALRDDNAVRCWGENDQNQLGDLSRESSATRGEPTTPRSDHGQVLALGSGGDHHCIVSNNGSLVCWGATADAAIGTGTDVQFNPEGIVRDNARAYADLPTEVDQVAGRGSLTCVRADGRVACMGPPASPLLLADGWTDAEARTEAPAMARHRFDQLAASARTTCAVSETRETRCWGGDFDPARYDGAQGSGHLVPASVPGSRVILGESGPGGYPSIVYGGSVGFATNARLQNRVFIWGGQGAPLLQVVDIDPGGSVETWGHVPGADGTTGFTLGRNHACWIELGGAPRCFGRDTYGQLGDDASFASPNPGRSFGGPVAGLSIARAVAGGEDHTCAILELDDSLHCWGRNHLGQLGTGGTTDQPEPIAPVNLPATPDLIAGGGHATCAVADGSLTCVGDTGGGADPSAQVFGIAGVDAVEIGKSPDEPSGCARADGILHCWGLLGGAYDAPVSVGENVELFTVGPRHVCWADADRLRCQGDPSSGALGGYDLNGLRYVGAPE